MDELCQHLQQLTDIKEPKDYVCDECVKVGGRWVHLRTCQTCGVTLCCDNSPAKHATAHFHETGHPVVASAEPGERWMWCYEDEGLGKY
jgi:uncharacterized UBP type Zn finger protein